MRNVLTASIGIAAFLLGATALQVPADARQVGGVRVGGGNFHAGTVNRNFSANRNINRSVNRNVSRNANINRNVDVNRNRNVNVNRNVKYGYRTLRLAGRVGTRRELETGHSRHRGAVLQARAGVAGKDRVA
jgi:hypothetical protein